MVLSLFVKLDPHVHEHSQTHKTERKVCENVRVLQVLSISGEKVVTREDVSTQAIIEVLDLILVLQPMLDYNVRVEHSCEKVEHEYILHQLKK